MRRILSGYKPLVMMQVLLVMVAVTPAVGAELPRITATQSLIVEVGPTDYGALGTIVVDMALGARWHVTYIHDRGWFVGGRHQEHDVSVTRVLDHDRTATLGWRVKVPEKGESVQRVYAIWAWRWGQ